MFNTLLRGVVGSKAHGLDTPESDTDYLGIHAVDTDRLFTIASQPSETIVTNGVADSVSHEVHKACRLLLSCNPSVTEVLWLDGYTELSMVGEQLLALRRDFLSRKRVIDAYIGFADQQFKRLELRGRYPSVPDNDRRRVKHSVHLLRLVEQGTHLLATGELKVKVDDPQWIRATAHEIAEGGEAGIALAREILDDTISELEHMPSLIPEAPRYERVEKFIQRVRRHYLKDTIEIR